MDRVKKEGDKVSTNRPIYHFSKRVFDIITSSLALVGLSPVFLVIAILIKRQDGGSPFYAQTRVGKNGKLFKIYKFRSMISNADKVLKQNPDLYRKYVDNGFKLPAEEDPRITKLGRFLRKTSLDEMPQFYNVLKGEMSMVGPRPIIQDELAEYGNRVDKLLSVKPGAFGLWQASGRSNVTYPERCDVELEYVDNASAMYDLKIFFKTIISIIKKDGAF
ncbi:sugar transferase [Lactobacillus colini]|uniref:sugar transferase n=1 Tax=Lactobacillus colini TaxID=1819254 RepID=UPI001AEAB8CD|nr:sugar transferase [Lactobacillus colini]